MQRVFTKDVGKLFKSGEIKDFPAGTWSQIEKSAGEKLSEFTKTVSELSLIHRPTLKLKGK